jgi:SAM-dependent methyltransferase
MFNRQRWNAGRFHETLASLADVTAGKTVLDLGCGRGASLGHLLNAVQDSGKVVGFDQLSHSFIEVERQYPNDTRSGRLILRSGNALDLPFSENTFDAVLCQNVVECVHDRHTLVLQAKRVLKPGGILLLGHHDFDGIMIAGSERGLTRRLVQGYANQQQEWQEACEGQMGRLLPGLVAGEDFETIEIETRISTDLDLSEASYARTYVAGVVALAPTFGIGQDEAQRWAQELTHAAVRGQFFFALPWVAAICRKARV